MAQEMAEQPAGLRELIGRLDTIGERVRAVAPVPMTGITIVARGSSDHAAVYGRYIGDCGPDSARPHDRRKDA
jgi:glucosamine--fructose-6-phosphate aminotransferase (isomerizing)